MPDTPMTIDLTPTWADVLPLLLASIESGNSVAHDAAKKELQRMATAADNYNDFVSRSQETKPETPPIPRVEVYQYLGYNGGFARERILLWVCDVIGVSGERRRACAASWHGNPDKVYALRHAAEKHAFNGWPVFDIGRQEQRDDKPKN